MGNETKAWKRNFGISMIMVMMVFLFVIWTELWFLAAIPIGWFFGFFLQKGNLCGSSAFSGMLMMKDNRKVNGIWVLIVVSMLGFAALDLLGWVSLNPKPLIYLNILFGGLLFGIGIVLAGGCVTGCLYKAATGNLNSMGEKN